MQWYNKALHALGTGAIDIPSAISAGQLKMSYCHGYTPDTSDSGHELKSDFDAAGGVIDSTVVLDAAAGATWSNRLLDANDGLTVTDPGAATPDSTHVLVWIDTGTPSTSRLLAIHTLSTPHAWDGTDDVVNTPNGILELVAS